MRARGSFLLFTSAAILFSFAFLICFDVGPSLFATSHAPSAPASEVVPYTVSLQQSSAEPGYESKTGMTITWAMRSDGARAMRVESNVGKPLVERMLDFPSGQHVTIMDLTKKKSTVLDATRSAAQWLRYREDNCVVPGGAIPEVFAGFEAVAGYKAAKITKGPGTFWYTTEYGCALVKSTISAANWTNETTLVKLVPGEPSSDLFLAAGYEEVAPSGLYGATSGQTKIGDTYYYAHRPH